MSMEIDDKQVERDRYDQRATQILFQDRQALSQTGLSYLPDYLRTPYIYFEKCLIELLKPGIRVLEIGAGSGQHTDVLVKSGADVTATDISPNSLKLLERRIQKFTGKAVKTRVADMESLPFEDNSFDFIVCAGSLSYGDVDTVNNEFKRVLCSGGSLVCVDSLDHNPVYRLNRLIGYFRGNRSKSTLLRMPDMKRIDSLAEGFDEVEVRYFGAFSFIMPLVSKIIGNAKAKQLSDRLDSLIACKKAGFKFVMVATDLKK